jgi:hypothetical protein
MAPVDETSRRIKPVTNINRAADDDRLIAVNGPDLLRRDYRDVEALLRERLPRSRERSRRELRKRRAVSRNSATGPGGPDGLRHDEDCLPGEAR